MKRPATSAAVPKYGSKKPKVTARVQKLSKLSKQRLQRMVDVIDFVGSQSSVLDGGARSVTSVKSSVTDQEENRDALKEIDDSFTQDALTACSNLRAEIVKLTNVIQLQQVQIGGLEKQLTTVVSMLQNISSQQQSQQNQLQNSNRPDRRTRSDRVVWGQRIDPNAGNEDNNVDANENESDPNVQYDSDFTLIVHRTLNDVSRRKRNIIITGLPEETETAVSDQTTFEEFAAAFLPFKPALATGRSCIRLGKASPFRPRRLLVRLESEEAAVALLRDAPGLRRVDDKYIAQNVFINADLSPSAAKLAYEARMKRRESQRRRAAAGDRVSGSGLSSDARSNSSQHPRGAFESTTAADSSPAGGLTSSAGTTGDTAAADVLVESGNSMDTTAASGATTGLATAAVAVASSDDVITGNSELVIPAPFR